MWSTRIRRPRDDSECGATDFVARVTGSGPEHIPAPQRIATFDNDGTLWAEQPLQTQFLFGRMLRAKF